MKYSIEPKGQIFVKGHGLLSFAKNLGKNIITQNLSDRYSQKRLDHAQQLNNMLQMHLKLLQSFNVDTNLPDKNYY